MELEDDKCINTQKLNHNACLTYFSSYAHSWEFSGHWKYNNLLTDRASKISQGIHKQKRGCPLTDKGKTCGILKMEKDQKIMLLVRRINYSNHKYILLGWIYEHQFDRRKKKKIKENAVESHVIEPRLCNFWFNCQSNIPIIKNIRIFFSISQWFCSFWINLYNMFF